MQRAEMAEFDLIIECDSSLTGASTYSKTHYVSELYPKDILERHFHIAQLEAFILVASLNALRPPNQENII